MEKIIGEKPDELKNVNTRVAKEIVHLTYTRIKIQIEDKGWNYKEIIQPIILALNKFLLNVPKENIDKKYFSLMLEYLKK